MHRRGCINPWARVCVCARARSATFLAERRGTWTDISVVIRQASKRAQFTRVTCMRMQIVISYNYWISYRYIWLIIIPRLCKLDKLDWRSARFANRFIFARTFSNGRRYNRISARKYYDSLRFDLIAICIYLDILKKGRLKLKYWFDWDETRIVFE